MDSKNEIENLLINFIYSNKMDEEKIIVRGIRGRQFSSMIGKLLVGSGLKSKYIDILLDEYSLSIYDVAFTHSSANSYSNYEFYELLGDKTVNKSIAWYLARRFPHLMSNPQGPEIMTKLITKFQSKKSLSSISKDLNFWDYISADKASRDTKKTSILEDVFEAFVGVTEYLIDERIKQGAGYIVSYNIIKSIFDRMEDISTEWEYITDPITKITETFKSNDLKIRGIGILNPYDETQDPVLKQWTVVISRKVSNRDEVLGSGIDSKKQMARNKAAVEALDSLKQRGFFYSKQL